MDRKDVSAPAAVEAAAELGKTPLKRRVETSCKYSVATR